MVGFSGRTSTACGGPVGTLEKWEKNESVKFSSKILLCKLGLGQDERFKHYIHTSRSYL